MGNLDDLVLGDLTEEDEDRFVSILKDVWVVSARLRASRASQTY